VTDEEALQALAEFSERWETRIEGKR